MKTLYKRPWDHTLTLVKEEDGENWRQANPAQQEHGTQPHGPPSGSVNQEHQQVGHRLCACVVQEVEIEVATKLADVKLDAVVD